MHPPQSANIYSRAQFARRDMVYYSRHNVKTQDAFVMICTITTEPASPQPPSIPRMSVPKGLLDAFGSMLDDHMYSDIEFVLPRRGGGLRNARKIYAAKKILRRADYFDSSEPFLDLRLAPCI